jgi:hypothetical protein
VGFKTTDDWLTNILLLEGSMANINEVLELTLDSCCKVYTEPELIRLGTVVDLTQTGGADS